MTSPRLLITMIFFAVACSSKQDLSHPAMTAVQTPVYDGMISALAGKRSAMLPPQKVVYLKQSSITVNGLKFVEVTWNDSSGYVPDSWVLPMGKPAVLNGTLTGPVKVYSDAGLKTPNGDILESWTIVSMGRSGTMAKEIMYAHGDNPVTGFIPAADASVDSLDILFYHAYEQVGGDIDKMKALSKDSRFASLEAYKKMFTGGDVNAGIAPSGGSTVQRHVPIRWENRDGTDMAKEDYPGEFALYYVFQDGSESQINHLGDTLDNGYPRCLPVGQKSVAKYKLVFIPSLALDFDLMLAVDLDPAYTERKGEPFEQAFENCEAGKPYVFIVEYPNQGYVTCGDATITLVTSLGHTGTGKLSASCGD